MFVAVHQINRLVTPAISIRHNLGLVITAKIVSITKVIDMPKVGPVFLPPK